MIQVNKYEADYLRQLKLGHYIHISSAAHKSKAKRYYVTEEPRVLKKLTEYRDSIIATDTF